MIAFDLLNLSNDSLESLRVVYCEVCENLAVNLDAGLVQSTHQCRIGHILQTCGSVDTLDPQCAECTLFVAAVTVCVCETLFPGVLGYGPNILTRSIVTTCKL